MSFVSPDFELFQAKATMDLVTGLTTDNVRVGGFLWINSSASPDLYYLGFTTDRVCLSAPIYGGQRMWLYSDGKIKIS